MDLTNGELRAIYEVLYDEYFYGRELMYQATEEAENVSTALEKIDAEIKRRRP